MQNLPALIRWQRGLWRWLKEHHDQFDLIHACDFDTVLPALCCKLRWRKKVVYDIFDFYADHLRQTPDWIKRIIRRLDLWAVNRADAVILVDDSRREQIGGSKPKLLEIIYNSPVDDPMLKDALAQEADRRRFTIAYIGLLQKERGLVEMLDVLLRHPEWRLDLAGFGGDEYDIVSQARMMSNVSWHGRIDYQKTLAISRQADVLFATYDPAIPNHRYSSPNKIFEAMMLAKPIIVARGTNMDRIIEQSGCGLVVPYGDVNELESTLIKLSRDADLREQLGRNARRAYDENYGWAIMEKRLIALYNRVARPLGGQSGLNQTGGEKIHG